MLTKTYLLIIRGGKGNKDRSVPLPSRTLTLLRAIGCGCARCRRKCTIPDHDSSFAILLNRLTLADAQETVRAAAVLRAGRRLPVLVDIRGQKSQDRDARQYYGSPEMTQSATAVALLVGSRVSMLIANFYITVTKTKMPTRIFTDETEALAWLKGFSQ